MEEVVTDKVNWWRAALKRSCRFGWDGIKKKPSYGAGTETIETLVFDIQLRAKDTPDELLCGAIMQNKHRFVQILDNSFDRFNSLKRQAWGVDMQYSNLGQVWKGIKFLSVPKIRNCGQSKLISRIP